MTEEHTETCPYDCPPCFREKLRSINFGASAMPTRRMGASDQRRAEKELDKDLSAYKRLRQEGMQPKSTKGAAQIEATASTRFEVERGVVVDKYLAKRVDETKAQMQEGNLL